MLSRTCCADLAACVEGGEATFKSVRGLLAGFRVLLSTLNMRMKDRALTTLVRAYRGGE